MESHSSITYTFHNVVKKQNSYQSTNRRRRPEPTPGSLLCPSYNTTTIKHSEGSILVSAHASMVYAVGRINSKTKQIIPTVLPN
jgi:hypothetical protein